jgi:hypothetical protein
LVAGERLEGECGHLFSRTGRTSVVRRSAE